MLLNIAVRRGIHEARELLENVIWTKSKLLPTKRMGSFYKPLHVSCMLFLEQECFMLTHPLWPCNTLWTFQWTWLSIIVLYTAASPICCSKSFKQGVVYMIAWHLSLTSSGWRGILFGYHYCSPQPHFKPVSVICCSERERRGRPAAPEPWLRGCVSRHPHILSEGAKPIVSLVMVCSVLIKIILFSCLCISIFSSFRFLWYFIVFTFVFQEVL